jgi:hypothetical protein
MQSGTNWLRAGLLTVSIMGMATAAMAQSQEEKESAFSTQPRDLGGFVELDTRFGDMMGEFAAFAGARLALRLKNRIYLGLGGSGLATDNDVVTGPSGSSQTLEMGYGGLLIGYSVPTRELFDVTADVLVGAGGVKLEGSGQDDAFFLFEPSLGVELRVAPVVRLGLGAGYRFVGGADLPGVRDDDLRGLTGTASVRLGWF